MDLQGLVSKRADRQLYLRERLQPFEGVLAVVLAAKSRRMSQRDFHRSPPLITKGVRQRGRDCGHEGDHQQAQEQQAEIAKDRLDRLFDRHLAD